MNEDTKIFSCEHCDYTSKWKCNTIRHMVRNHTAPKAIPNAPKAIQTAPKAIPKTPKAIPTTANVCPTTSKVIYNLDDNNVQTNQCEKCNKCFARRYTLNKHINICKGNINPLQCNICMQVFTHRNNKYKHLKQCKNNIIIEKDPYKDEQNFAVQNITNNNTTNNNITNNNTIIQQIVVFDPKNMELLNDHITKKELQKMVINTDFSKVLTDYSTALLSRKENQCVRKTNLNSCSSAIHVGDNKWEFQTDKAIYPKLLTRIAYNFSDMKESFNIKVYEQLDTFIDDVASEAEDCHTDEKDEIRLKRLYKKLFNNIKHLIFNLTKKEDV